MDAARERMMTATAVVARGPPANAAGRVSATGTLSHPFTEGKRQVHNIS